MSQSYDVLLRKAREVGQIESVEALLDWDQETYMPPNGIGARADQLAMIARMGHDLSTSDELGQLLDELGDGGSDVSAATNLRELRRSYARKTKIPSALVGRIASTSAMAKVAWVEAKANAHFPTFAPHLSELLELKREMADLIGFEGERYDALMDEFEPGALSSDIAELFESLRGPVTELVAAIASAAEQPDVSILHRTFPTSAQDAFARKLATAIGFDFNSGRLDVSAHPFCSGTTPGDVRLTTRFYEDYFNASIFGTLHEAGHGLYEQGLDPELMFTPAGQSVSLGIHESQSLMWENMVGRSRPFWDHFYPDCRAAFPSALGDVSLDAFFKAINAVRPSLIRVEADEVTYTLHIILRFELERGLLNGTLAVEDVPDAWNTKMQEVLSVTPGDDGEGCLQDIHWSMGSFGYFPTYALGKLYAAQFFASAKRAIPDLVECIGRGEFAPLLDWLRTNIHKRGRRYLAADLVREVTGEPLSTAPLMTYLREKFLPIYGLQSV